jgi:hypothetical protein
LPLIFAPMVKIAGNRRSSVTATAAAFGRWATCANNDAARMRVAKDARQSQSPSLLQIKEGWLMTEVTKAFNPRCTLT